MFLSTPCTTAAARLNRAEQQICGLGSRRNPQLSLTSTWFSHPPETPSASGQGPVALWYSPTRSLSSKMGSNVPDYPNPRPPLVVKTSPLEEDFLVGSSVLGAGINGKVVECTDRRSGHILPSVVWLSMHCNAMMHAKYFPIRSLSGPPGPSF